MLTQFSLHPLPTDVPPLEVYALSGCLTHAAASSCYDAAVLHVRLVEPRPWPERILAAHKLRDTARRLAADADRVIALLESLRNAERRADDAALSASVPSPPRPGMFSGPSTDAHSRQQPGLHDKGQGGASE